MTLADLGEQDISIHAHVEFQTPMQKVKHHQTLA